ncbi:MAG: MFS transporter [Alicyclobacillus herbarius]|uniref:MFS transporter n=1 Tax=Alicyclobacillus herbarius TaxID=122960 RepID=UPI0023538173|nr:MFS transporter [Alicyclobacillus herbarius]MCL6631543.1 MFS transporter [Alicyclobacillus herbarius]
MRKDSRQPSQPPVRWLLAISAVFALSVGLSNTFVNVYLWKVDHSYVPIGWYNFAMYTFIPIMFVLAGWLSGRWNAVWTLRIGITLHAGFYLLTLIGGTELARHPFPMGVLMGCAAGFYWLSFNYLSLRLTQGGGRDRFYGSNGALGAIAGMAAPLTSGFIISHEDRFGGLSGYHVIFSASLALFLLAVLLSSKLRVQGGGKLEICRIAGGLNNPWWRNVLAGCFVYGWREGVFLFLIGLLMYIATGSEMKLGEFLLLQSGLSFMSFSLVSRWLKPRHRVLVMGIGACGMAAAALLFLIPLSARLVVWYGCCVAIVLPLFLVPLQGTVFDAISRLDATGEDDVEHIIAREVVENAGRVAGIAAFLILVARHPNAWVISRFAVALGFVQLGTWALIAWAHRKQSDITQTGSGDMAKALERDAQAAYFSAARRQTARKARH